MLLIMKQFEEFFLRPIDSLTKKVLLSNTDKKSLEAIWTLMTADISSAFILKRMLVLYDYQKLAVSSLSNLCVNRINKLLSVQCLLVFQIL